MVLKDKLKSILEDRFVFHTSILSLVMAILFSYKGFKEGFNLASFLVISYSVSYSVLFLLLKRKIFFTLQIIYSLILIFLETCYKTTLSNNFTAFFCITMAIIVDIKKEKFALIVYFITIMINFMITEEDIYDILTHFLRCLWILEVVFEFHKSYFRAKMPPLVIDEKDEIILQKLIQGYEQKEIEEFSENTVCRRIKEMMKRNNCKSKVELQMRYLDNLCKND